MALYNYSLTFLITYFRILFLTAGFLLAILKFLFSLVMTVLSPIYSIVAPIVSPVIATLNARFISFLQSLLVQTPWLGKALQPVVRFLSPIISAPAFQVVQGIFMLAAVPYIAAAAVSTMMFVYTFGIRLIVNVGRVVYDYLYRSTHATHKYLSVVGTLKKVSNEISDLYNDRYNAWDQRAPRSAVVKVFLILLQCASLLVLMPFAFVNRLVTFGIEGVYGIAHAFSDACTTAKDAFNATLDIPLLRIMRRSWTTVVNPPLDESVNNKAHEFDNKEADSNQTTNTPQLDSKGEINMDTGYRLNVALETVRQNRAQLQI